MADDVKDRARELLADECLNCLDSGWAETSHGGIWTGEGVWSSYAICDCICGQDVRREQEAANAQSR